MAYWNHFTKSKYKEIFFSSIQIGCLFRDCVFNGHRQHYIIMKKISDTEYVEVKSNIHHHYFNSKLANIAKVYTYTSNFEDTNLTEMMR